MATAALMCHGCTSAARLQFAHQHASDGSWEQAADVSMTGHPQLSLALRCERVIISLTVNTIRHVRLRSYLGPVASFPQAAAKRFKVTGSGKLMARHSGKQHMNEKMDRDTKRWVGVAGTGDGAGRGWAGQGLKALGAEAISGET